MKTPGKRGKLNCIFCEKTFKTFENLDNHTRIHTNEKPIECKRCSHSANHPSSLKIHMRTHTGERPFKCNVCYKAFTISCNLNRHMRIHKGEKPYKCELCGKCFGQYAHLQTHIRTHTLEKPYKCEICNKRFTASTNLKIHQAKIHSINRDNCVIKCVFCMKDVFLKHHYYEHIRTHISERPHFCRFCSRGFASNFSCKKHELKGCKKR